MRAARIAVLVAVPIAVVFAGPALLGYGWGRFVAAIAACACAALLVDELAP